MKAWQNQYDYGARIYDPRGARFLSVDPITNDYPGLTPYQFAANTPIWASDLDGLEADFSGVKMQKEKRVEYGHWFLNYAANKDAIYHNMAASAYNGIIDMAEDATNLVGSEKGRQQVLSRYGHSMVAMMELGDKFKKGEISFEQMWQATKEFFKNPENIENLGGSLLTSLIPASMLTKIKLPTSWQNTLKPLAKVFEGLGKKDVEIPSTAGVGAMRMEYEGVKYHGKTDNAVKNRAPVNGQDALGTSLQIKKTSPRRVGIDYEKMEFVVFDQHRPGKYHGHVRSWKELNQDMQNTLKKAGMANDKGKILVDK